MDIHSVPGVKARDVAEAHRKDLLCQHEYGCNCMTYWIDEARETIFCLIEASDRDAVKNMHSKAHGLVPHKIIEVSSTVVQSFLGRIYDPDDAVIEDGLKVFANPGFRIILVCRTQDRVLLKHRLGPEAFHEVFARTHAALRENILQHQGSEVEHAGDGFIVSFESASQAIRCALSIQDRLSAQDSRSLDLRLALSAGEPIENSNFLFGDAIELAHRLCSVAGPDRVALAAGVRELAPADLQQGHGGRLFSLSRADEEVLRQLFATVGNHFRDPGFNMESFARAMAMSQTQLYRKVTALTGFSSNNLLKEYRLEKAAELMRKGRHSISQVAYDTGFSSPSYFTKCFKGRHGLLPMEYSEIFQLS